MEKLTLQQCRFFETHPTINPLTGRSIKLGGPLFLSLVEKCQEIKRKHTALRPLPTSLAPIDDFKPIILRELETLRKEELANKNLFKVRSYEKVIKGIQVLDYPIKTWEDLKHVEGIGTKIEAKIKEILQEGSLFRAAEIRLHPRTAVIEELMTVYGIGGSKANELYKQGIRSIAELRRHSDLLNEVQKIGLRYYDDLQQRIPREEMQLHERVLASAVEGTPFRFEVVGSYRRGADSSGDIDVILTLPDKSKSPISLFYDLIDRLKEGGYLEATLGEGVKKYMGIAKIPYYPARHIDLLLTKESEYPYALVYFTGNKLFNIRIRSAAIEKGYSLSEYGLIPIVKGTGASPVFRSEKGLIEFLLGTWFDPTDRNW